MPITKELLDELMKGCERPEDRRGDSGLMKEPKIKLMERTLNESPPPPIASAIPTQRAQSQT